MVAPLTAAAQAHGVLAELLIDRGYLASPTVGALAAAGVTITAKPWPTRNGDRFPTHAFAIDLGRGEVRCPAGATAGLAPGATAAHFPAATCQRRAQRPACTTARRRSIAIHPQEALLHTLRARQQTSAGRAPLRQRTAVEHALARVQQLHGPRARYKGVRKNTLDVRRIAAVTNLQRIARVPKAA
jgi:IS5 family transposase